MLYVAATTLCLPRIPDASAAGSTSSSPLPFPGFWSSCCFGRLVRPHFRSPAGKAFVAVVLLAAAAASITSHVVRGGLTMALQAITLSIDPIFSCDPAKTPGSDAACAFCGSFGRSMGRARVFARRLPEFRDSLRALPPAAAPRTPPYRRGGRPGLAPRDQPTGAERHDARDPRRPAGARRGRSCRCGVSHATGAALSNLYYARAVLADRRGAAEARAGTASRANSAWRCWNSHPPLTCGAGELLDGLRLLPLGRFFEGELDVYPEIVGFWREHARVPTPSERSPVMLTSLARSLASLSLALKQPLQSFCELETAHGDALVHQRPGTT